MEVYYLSSILNCYLFFQLIFYCYHLQVLQVCLIIVYHFIVLLIRIFARVFYSLYDCTFIIIMDWWGRFIASWFSFLHFEEGFQVKNCVSYCVTFVLTFCGNYLITLMGGIEIRSKYFLTSSIESF